MRKGVPLGSMARTDAKVWGGTQPTKTMEYLQKKESKPNFLVVFKLMLQCQSKTSSKSPFIARNRIYVWVNR